MIARRMLKAERLYHQRMAVLNHLADVALANGNGRLLNQTIAKLEALVQQQRDQRMVRLGIELPLPDPQPVPEPDPLPDPQPLPDPLPDPQPIPEPDPLPDPQPAPAPEPVPEPDPEPVPLPAPEPEPVPEPSPEPADDVPQSP